MLEHLVCIMDGNRRWIREQKLLDEANYKQSVKSIKTTIQFCLGKKINYLSLYAFSIENLKRSKYENNQLFSFIMTQAEQLSHYLAEHDVCLKVVGDHNLFPPSVHNAFNKIEQQTEHCSGLYVQLLFCYGGQQEIVQGVKSVVKKIQAGVLHLSELDERSFAQHLWTASVPFPDLIIRTGGYARLSNCLLFQSAYSELCFLDCLWPDLTFDHLRQAVDTFTKSRRNFGK